MLQDFQGICQGIGVAPSVCFMVSFILVLYLKYKVQGVEIKTELTGDDLKLVTMMFVNNRDLLI